MNEQELISRSKAGDLDSFNQLVETYQQQVYNLALRQLGSAAAAEDAAQDTFFSAYRAISRFRGGNFKAWLLRIAVNACHDQFRIARKRRIISLEAENQLLVDQSESPEDYALRQELGSIISQGLSELPEEQRLVVVLCDLQGLSYEEVAQATGCSLGTVKSRLSRGRERLKRWLVEHRELLPDEFRHYK